MRTSNYKKICAVLIPLFVLALIIPHFAHAAIAGVPTSFDEAAGMLASSVGKVFQAAMELIVLPLASLMMSLAGTLLDATMKFSLSSGFVFSNMPVINQVWTIIRDFCNIFFIFALIWISINIILDLGGNAKRNIANVIIAALIINFSLYFTKVFIDASNIFGMWLYNGVMKLLVVNGALNYSGGGSLSALIAAKLDIFQLWTLDFATAKNMAKSLSDPTQGAITAILKLIVVLIATYVFTYTAILFITRAVTIVFLLALSPIGFVGSLFPKLDEYAKKWWHELIDAITFPIVYLLMLFVSLQFINNISKEMLAGVSTGIPKFSELISFPMIFKYVIVIAALLICLKIAKDSAGALGKAASGIAGGMAKFSTSLGAGSAKFLGQYTFGAAATRAANSRIINQTIASGGVLGAAAGAAKGGLDKVGDYHFDVRAGIKEFGVKGGKGYQSKVKDQAKAQEQAMKDIAPEKSDLKTAKGALEVADMNVYSRHDKFGKNYEAAAREVSRNQTILDDATKSADEKKEALKNINRAKQELSDAKTLINDDDKYKAEDKIYEERQQRAKIASENAARLRAAGNISDAEKEEKLREALEATMRQEKAARSAKKGVGVSIAKAFDKPFSQQNLVAKALNVGTLGIAGAAGKQYMKDVNNTVKKLRGAMKADEDKKQQDKIAKMLARMAGGDEGTTPSAPAPTPTPPAPPAGGGTP
jgi:hypothetical protein